MALGLAWLLLVQAAGAAAAPPAAPLSTVPADDPAEIAKDAQRDLKDNRFYNKPGATRAQYDAAWQECRLIARGSRTPAGMVTTVYNPNLISPAMAGAAGGLGAAIGAAIVEGMLRRANRRECLLVHGWRLVEIDAAEQARVAAMGDADRQAYFDGIVGAAELPGKKVTSWHNDYAAPRLAPEPAK